MPSIEAILNKGFSNGTPWDSNSWRKAILLWICPVAALVIALSGGTYIYHDVQQDYPVGYVVSSSEDCTLVVAARPDGPPVATVREHSGGRFGTCGGLDKNQRVHYDPGERVQAFGQTNNVVGMVFIPVAALLGLVPATLAWIDTLRKRRARWQALPGTRHPPPG